MCGVYQRVVVPYICIPDGRGGTSTNGNVVVNQPSSKGTSLILFADLNSNRFLPRVIYAWKRVELDKSKRSPGISCAVSTVPWL